MLLSRAVIQHRRRTSPPNWLKIFLLQIRLRGGAPIGTPPCYDSQRLIKEIEGNPAGSGFDAGSHQVMNWASDGIAISGLWTIASQHLERAGQLIPFQVRVTGILQPAIRLRFAVDSCWSERDTKSRSPRNGTAADRAPAAIAVSREDLSLIQDPAGRSGISIRNTRRPLSQERDTVRIRFPQEASQQRTPNRPVISLPKGRRQGGQRPAPDPTSPDWRDGETRGFATALRSASAATGSSDSPRIPSFVGPGSFLWQRLRRLAASQLDHSVIRR